VSEELVFCVVMINQLRGAQVQHHSQYKPKQQIYFVGSLPGKRRFLGAI